MKYTIIGIVILVLIALSYATYIGSFSKTEIFEADVPSYQVAYKEFIGPYTNVGPTMDLVNDALVEDGIESTLGFGIYFDDPQKKDANELRSEVGTIIQKEDSKKLDKSGEKYLVKTIGGGSAIVSEFPIKGFLSYMIGPMKVYSAMMDYMNEKGIEWTEEMPAVEIYDIENKKITYFVLINNK